MPGDSHKIYVEGVTELRQKLRTLTDKDRRMTRTALRKGGNVVLKNARKRAPKQSGNLRKALAVSVGVTQHVEFIKIGPKKRARARHAHLIELGARSHTIKARNARVMGYKPAGKVYGTRVRNHPGTRAQPFLVPAFHESKQEAIDKFKEEMRALIAKLTV